MGRRYAKGIDLYEAQKRRFDKLKLDRYKGHRELADAALADARELTSGTLTPSQTRGAFARGSMAIVSTAFGRRRSLSGRQLSNRGLSGQAPLLPINLQSQKLHDSFRLLPSKGGSQAFDLAQSDPGGGIWRLKPGGTRKMVDSGFFPEIQRRWRPRNKAYLDFYSKKQRSS